MKNPSTTLVRLHPTTLSKIRELQKRIVAVYERDGAPGNAHFVKDASMDSIIYILVLEAEQRIKASEPPEPKKKAGAK